MNKKIIFAIFAVFLLLTIAGCKEKKTKQEVKEDKDTKDYFDSLVEDDAGEDTSHELDADDEDADAGDPDDDDTIEIKRDYPEPACGDGVCSHYETHNSCSEDCEKLEETTLGDYPDFLDDVVLVVGSGASSTDVITATLLSTFLVASQIDAETILASEISEYEGRDMILIGAPCVNEAIMDMMHYTDETCTGIIQEQNNAVIKLLVEDDHEVIILSGYDDGDTKDASAMLTDPSYNLNGAEQWVNLASNGDINVYFSKN